LVVFYLQKIIYHGEDFRATVYRKENLPWGVFYLWKVLGNVDIYSNNGRGFYWARIYERIGQR
jgi:hypothetical protein